MDNFCVKEQDILDVYKEEGKFNEYNYGKDYLKFKELINKSHVKEIAKEVSVKYHSIIRWKNNQRVPYCIKKINFLKEKGLIPYTPNTRTARIVGFLHGDGYLNKNLLSFGFVSSELSILQKLKEEVGEEFKIKGKIKKKRDIGDNETIHNKTFVVKRLTYDLKFNNKAICALLFKLGVPRGKKIYQKYSVPSWIMRGNIVIKKGFLQGLFDSELSNARISTFKNHKDNISSPRMEMGKIKSLENDLRDYLTQIKSLLNNFGITSRISCLREYIKNERISLILVINNKLSNIYNFTEMVGFYYNKERINKSLEVKNLALEKIKNKNVIYKLLNYCKNKDYFTLQDLENDLPISCSSSKMVGLYLYKNRLAKRERNESKWFVYYPNIKKMNKIINNPILLETLPRLKK